jgi:hypothetical protein
MLLPLVVLVLGMAFNVSVLQSTLLLSHDIYAHSPSIG